MKLFEATNRDKQGSVTAERRVQMDLNDSFLYVRHFGSHLYTLSLPAEEGFLHHAVVLAQHPALIYQLGIKSSEGGDAMSCQSVFLLRLRCPFGVVNVEDHISLRHIKVPGDDGGRFRDLNQHLDEDARRSETQENRLHSRKHAMKVIFQLGAALPRA